MTNKEILKEYERLDIDLKNVIKTKALKRLNKATHGVYTSFTINKEIINIYKDYNGFRGLIEQEIESIYTHDYAGH